MKAGEIHRYIWQYVIERMRELGDRPYNLAVLKHKAIGRLYSEKRIGYNELERLMLNHKCVLCALYVCSLCPLKSCVYTDSLYMRASKHDLEAAEKIRDVRFGKEDKEL